MADRLNVLAKPARLAVLNALTKGPLHVSAIVEETGLNHSALLTLHS